MATQNKSEQGGAERNPECLDVELPLPLRDAVGHRSDRCVRGVDLNLREIEERNNRARCGLHIKDVSVIECVVARDSHCAAGSLMNGR